MGCRLACPATRDPIYNVLNEAWAQFWSHPDKYAEWESASISWLRSLYTLPPAVLTLASRQAA